MVTIAGYEVTAKLHESSRTVVYQGQRPPDSRSFILKVTQSEYPSLEELSRYRLEYEILTRLNLPGVPQAYGLERHQNGLALILDDFGGESLHRLMQIRKLTLMEFLQMAIGICEILSQVHAANVIHKDINPTNIVLNRRLGQVQLIDFGNATVLSRENPTLRNPNLLEGTLAYLSPEQTGRMNRSLDYRTDFYSLGAAFYAVLTGSPPFASTDAMELIYSHLAKQPLPPHVVSPEIPEAISQIVLKLLAKNAEDRYQSAYGIKADLQHCLEQLQTNHTIALFPLAQQDASGRFQIPQKLYGREQEVATLLAAFESIVERGSVAGWESERTGSPLPPSTAGLMLVTGYSGIGKSALVQEIYKPITQRNGYFISGKFDQYQRNIPYSALIQAFQSLVQQLLTESEAAIHQWRSALLTALGMNSQVVIDVIPEVELIVGQQPAVPELAPQETQNRFNLVFQNFIKVFTQSQHPLVLFLDDLQWADAASLKLIERLMSAPNSQALFLVGAYRSNEISAVHPLMVTIAEMRKAGVTLNQIDLLPLNQETIQQVIADTCNCSPDAAQPLAEYVMQITGGNPFFMTEFLKSLYEEGLLNFDGRSGHWQWDLSQIQAAQLPDDVVELVSSKIQKLAAAAQQILKLAACIGSQFDLKTLALVAEDTQEVATHLWQGVQEGLLLPLGDYQFANVAGTQRAEISFQFLHDRVQQAAYSLIPEADKPGIHYRIGRSLLTHTPSEVREEKIFDIVNQLNVGISLIHDQKQRNELARLNLSAGNKAKESTAYDTALRYLLTGIGLLEEQCWNTQYDLCLSLHEAAAEAAYLNGDFAETSRLVERILFYARTVLDRVTAYQIKIYAYSAQNNQEAALDTFAVAMRSLGEPLPRHPSRLRVGLELLRTRFFSIGNRSMEQLEALPPMVDPYKLGVMRLAGSVVIAANNVDPLFTAVTALRIVNVVSKYGSSPQSAVQGVAYGIMLRVGLGETERAYKFGQLSLRLVDRRDARQYRTLTILGFETCLRHWKEPLRRSLPTLLSAYAEGLELGNLEAAALLASVYCFHLFFLGEPLATVAEVSQQYAMQLLRFGQEQTVYAMQPWHQLALHLQGLGTESDRLVGTAFNEDQLLPHFIQNQIGIPLFYTYIAKLIWLYHCGEYAGAIAAAQLAEPLQEASPVTTPYANLFFYWSLACLAHSSTLAPSQRKQFLRQVNKNQRKSKQWARHCPENYQHRCDLVEAECLRVIGRNSEAMEYYDRAIRGAIDQEYINEVALANELAGKFYLGLGKDKLAQIYLTDARYAYVRWGATFKVNALDALYPQLRDRTSEAATSVSTTVQAASTTASSSGSQGLNLDLNTVMRAAQAISGEIVLDQLLGTLLRLVIENAGAQKGVLLLMQQGELWITAEGQIEEAAAMIVRSRPLTEGENLPLSLISYVQRTREDLVLRDAAQEGLFTTDPYIVQMQPRSVLCTPILNQSNLMGMLYLENNLATDAFTAERVTILNILSAQAAIALENALFYRTLEQKVEDRTAELAQANQEITLLNERLQSENLRLGAELAITRQIQQMILPKEHELRQIAQLDIAGFMEPADEVGGDYYDVLYQNGSIKIGIGDITGHGLESGVLMLMVQTAVRTLLAAEETDSVKFFSALNHVIYENVERMNSDRNLTLALLDYEAGKLRLSGQHEEILVIRANGDLERIDTMDLGFPIGLVEDISEYVTQVELRLEAGDGVVLYTDGITEAADSSGNLYGLERLCQVACRNWQGSADQICQVVIEDVRSHIGTQKVFDDITLLVMKRKGWSEA